jgi:hypothetical protein
MTSNERFWHETDMPSQSPHLHRVISVRRGIWLLPGHNGHWLSRTKILVSAGSQGDLARDSAFASPVGRALTKGLSEEPAQMRLIRKAYAQRYFT